MNRRYRNPQLHRVYIQVQEDTRYVKYRNYMACCNVVISATNKNKAGKGDERCPPHSTLQ